MNSPTVTLSNGLTIANFSSPHPFTFITGEVLPACNSEWVNEMSLDITEIETIQSFSQRVPPIKWTDLELNIKIPDYVKDILNALIDNPNIDVIIVPFMVLDAMKKHKMAIGSCRTIRNADRITKEIYPDKFCI